MSIGLSPHLYCDGCLRLVKGCLVSYASIINPTLVRQPSQFGWSHQELVAGFPLTFKSSAFLHSFINNYLCRFKCTEFSGVSWINYMMCRRKIKITQMEFLNWNKLEKLLNMSIIYLGQSSPLNLSMVISPVSVIPSLLQMHV